MTRTHGWVATVLSFLLAACAGIGRQEMTSVSAETASAVSRELFATGFVVDRHGLIVTAGHAVDGCASLYVVKGTRTLAAEVVARSSVDDLALLRVQDTLAPPAVFAAGQKDGTTAVFVAGYRTLPRLLGDGGGLFNAVQMPSDGEQLKITLVSDAGHGASGAPVFDGNGLVIGVVSRRTSGDRVIAVGGEALRSFLAAHDVAIEMDSQPQLDAFQDRARHAATVSVGVRCFVR